jgi:hypothetical protein
VETFLQLAGLSNAGRGSDKGYLYLVPENFKEEDLMKKILLKHIFPGLHGESQPPPLSPNSTSNSQRSEDGVDDLNERSVFTCDGDLPQLNAIFSKDIIDMLAGLNIDVLKFSAACSLSQQPNDMHRGFPNLARITDQLSMKYSDLEVSQQPAYMADLERKLKAHSSLTPVQVRMMLKFFQHAPTIFARALSPRVVMDGFKKSGLTPYNCELIMENCSEWRNFNTQQADDLMQGIEDLVEFGAEHGWVSEKEMDRVGVEPSPQNWHDWDTEQMTGSEVQRARMTKKLPKPLNELTATRQRALWCNAEATLERRQAREEAKRVLEEEKDKRALERERKKEETIQLQAQLAVEKEEKRQQRETEKIEKEKLAALKKIEKEKKKADKAKIDALEAECKERKRQEVEANKIAAAQQKAQRLQEKKRRAEDKAAKEDKENAQPSTNRPAKSRKTATKSSSKSNECATCYVDFNKQSKVSLWRGCENCKSWWCGDCAVNIDAHETRCAAR